MICPQCRHENPAGNRFCGSCGTKLPVADVRVESRVPSVNWLKSMEENKPTGRDLELQRVEAEHAAREREIAERAERAARREREIAARAKAAAAASAQSQSQPQRPVVRGSSAGGPSFLGLSGGYEPDEPERGEELAEEYDRSDIYGGGRSYTRALLLLVLLLVIAGLGFLQWRYSSGLRASPPAEKPSATQPEQAGADEKQATPESPGTKAEDATEQKDQSSATAPTTENKAGSNNKSIDKKASSADEAASEPEEPRTGKMNPPAEPEQQAATPAEPKNRSKAASVPDKTNEQTEAKSKPPARVRAKTQPEVSDEPVRLAESYIYGRGLPQSCPQAVTILREASNRGNYKAQIKLGALYATGNCVSLDRVQAYRFLTRALQSKPGNTWVEQNRSMLWAQMNEQERRQAMEQNF